MFSTLTEYRGLDNGYHKFKVRQFDETNETSPRLYFLFDKNNTFIKARIEQIEVGSYDFVALIPFETKEFKDEDWVMEKCQRID